MTGQEHPSPERPCQELCDLGKGTLTARLLGDLPGVCAPLPQSDARTTSDADGSCRVRHGVLHLHPLQREALCLLRTETTDSSV